jgi:hypothetical protein
MADLLFMIAPDCQLVRGWIGRLALGIGRAAF